MKKNYLIVAVLSVISLVVNAQAQKKRNTAINHEEKAKPGNKLRQYFFVMLTKGPNREQDSVQAAAIQEGHMANITRLYNAGKLKVAGPFGDEGDWLGIFIFDCETKEETDTLLKTDPAVAAGRLSYEIHPWWTAETGSFKKGVPAKP